MEEYASEILGTFDCEYYDISKLGTEVGIPEVYPQQLFVQKSMVVDGTPKLAHDDWVREQSEDTDIGLLVGLLRSDKLNKYMAKEMDSSGIQFLLKYRRIFS